MSFGGFLANAFLGAVAGGAASVAEKAKEEARLARERELLQEQWNRQDEIFSKEQVAADARLEKQAKLDLIARQQNYANQVGTTNMEIEANKERDALQNKATEARDRAQHKDRMEEIGAHGKITLEAARTNSKKTTNPYLKLEYESALESKNEAWKAYNSGLEQGLGKNQLDMLKTNYNEANKAVSAIRSIAFGADKSNVDDLPPDQFSKMTSEINESLSNSKDPGARNKIIIEAARRLSPGDAEKLLSQLTPVAPPPVAGSPSRGESKSIWDFPTDPKPGRGLLGAGPDAFRRAKPADKKSIFVEDDGPKKEPWRFNTGRGY